MKNKIIKITHQDLLENIKQPGWVKDKILQKQEKLNKYYIKIDDFIESKFIEEFVDFSKYQGTLPNRKKKQFTGLSNERCIANFVKNSSDLDFNIYLKFALNNKEIMKKISIFFMDEIDTSEKLSLIKKSKFRERAQDFNSLSLNEMKNIIFNFFINGVNLNISKIGKDGNPSYDRIPIFILWSVSKILANEDNKGKIFYKIIYKELMKESNLKPAFKKVEYPIAINKNNKPSMAIMVSGQLRGNVLKNNLDNLFNKIDDNINYDVYLHTWDKHYVKPDIYSGLPNDSIFLSRASSISKNLSKKYFSVENVKRHMPKTYAKIGEKQYINTNINLLNKNSRFKKILIDSESKFEKKYKYNSNMKTRNWTLNQAKQLWSWRRLLQIIKQNKYDYLMRIRPDFELKTKIDKDFLSLINNGEIINFNSNPEVGPGDMFMLGRYDDFMKGHYNLANAAFNKKTLKLFTYNNNCIKSCSHKLLNMSYLNNCLYLSEKEIKLKKSLGSIYNIDKSVLDTLESECPNIPEDQCKSLQYIISRMLDENK